MPFRDRDWEDFQRDCAFFPAYTDYIFGIDTRPEVADEPGLHPHISSPPQPPQRLYGLPPVQVSIANNPAHLNTAPTPRLLKHESSLESLLPTPTPAPRSLPASGPPLALLRPGELADDAYAFIPLQDRMAANKDIIQAWAVLNSNAIRPRKTKAMGWLKDLTRAVVEKKAAYYQQFDDEVAAVVNQGANATHVQRETSPHRRLALAPHQEAEARTNSDPDQDADDAHAALIIQLRAYTHSRLPQLWTCTQLTRHPAPSDPAHRAVYTKAQACLAVFRTSVPPKGRQWFDRVIEGMKELSARGEDPMRVLDVVNDVLDV